MVLSFFGVSDIFGGVFWSGQKIFPIAPARAGFSVPSNLFGGIRSCCKVFNRLTARLEELFLGALVCPSVPYYERGYEIIWRTAFLHLGQSSTCLIVPLSHDREGLNWILFVPTFLNFGGVFPKFSEGLLHGSEMRSGKPLPYLLFYLSCDGEFLDELLPLYLTVFLVNPYFRMFCKEERIKQRQKNIISNILQGFYFRITFLRSDFEKYCTG